MDSLNVWKVVFHIDSDGYILLLFNKKLVKYQFPFLYDTAYIESLLELGYEILNILVVTGNQKFVDNRYKHDRF